MPAVFPAFDVPLDPAKRIARIAARVEVARRRKARDSYPAFYSICEPDYVYGDWLADLGQHLEWAERTPGANLMIFAPPRHGKALAVGTGIPTLHGMVKIEDLSPGDLVLGSDGMPTKVLGVHHWKNRPRYRVTTDDGHQVIVDGAHEWLVRLDRKLKAWSVRETQWLAARTSQRKPMIPMAQVQGQNCLLPIDPYTLGVWLGDGSRGQGTISKDSPDQPFFRYRIEAAGFTTTDMADGRRFGVLGLSTKLQAAGVDPDKHIPDIYFSAPVADRIALLQGLVDTDGYVAEHGQIEYCSVDEKLARGVARLVHSLGVKASLCVGRAMLNGVDYGPKYRVMFYYENAASLPRKAGRTKNGTKQPNRYLSFERIEDGDTVCIEVEAEDHLYLATDAYIVTHNSQSVSRVLPNYLLGRHPRSEVLVLSSTQDLADDFGRYVRNKLNDPVIQEIFPDASIDPSANATDKVLLKMGGGFRAVGTGGQIVGRGADWLIIDDPYKNRQQAYSANEREKLYNWYRTDARTRLAPGARQIIMHQRWHIDDLASKLLAIAAADPMADQWRVVIYPAICENQETDPLGREVGWPLDPVRWPISSLYALRAGLLETEWLALFQQRPVKEEGGFFKKDWMQLHSGVPDPKKLHWYIGWDGAASTSNSANKSAIMPVGFNEHGDGYLAPDYWLGRCTTLEQVIKVFDFIIKYKAIGVCVEKGMFERAIRPFYDVMIRERGLREPAVYSAVTHMISRTEGKHIVAIPLQARMNQRKLWFPNTPQTVGELIPQFLNFMPDADNDEDDGVDGLANLYQAISQMALPMPEPGLPVAKPEDEEDAVWKKIMSNLPTTNSAPFARLSGDPLRGRK